jgi:uncharacterized protein YkwD
MALATRPKPTVHHRKRQAKHHRQNKHYLKTYWPYLPMLLIVVVGIAINSALYSNTKVLGTGSDFSSATLLNGTNGERIKNHQTPLVMNPQLSAAAQAKANDMVTDNYWAHNSPDGQTPWTFIIDSGYQYQEAGENLAYGFSSASAAITGWMNSSEHRNNLLNSDFQEVGFGVANAANYQGKGPQTVIVAEYGQPSDATVLGSQNPAVISNELPVRSVSRVELLTSGNATWTGAVVGIITGAALMYFLLHHGYRLKRALNEGEQFVVHHPYVDIAVVFIITAGFILTRSTGIIH